MKYLGICLFIWASFNTSWAGAAEKAAWIGKLDLDTAPKLFTTPNPTGRQEFSELINEAKTSVKLYMYRLTDNFMISVMKKAAARGVKVQVLLDPVKLKEASMQSKLKNMEAGGIEVRGGSSAYSMTHAKSMLVDGKRVIVSTMNLTWTFRDSRGFGLVFEDASVRDEIERMFDADWRLAGGENVDVPEPQDANLIWTPGNSEAKLIDLVRASERSIEIVVENLGMTPFLDELIAAQGRGVKVRVIVPLCTTSSKPIHNAYFAEKLLAAKVDVRNVPMPHSEKLPYSHAKMMAVDGRYVYLGSQNFSKNSLQKSRELGIITEDVALYGEIIRLWNDDWSVAVPQPAKTTDEMCPLPEWGKQKKKPAPQPEDKKTPDAA
ncbi:MAG: phosphatidylserine/phosphatidylglycerophosphate/cardiolipin synthase family protein [Bdellovibrionaceae bacterium]|nr:phosphatidylserine/phosphatidylglycerophosphate/cardiolipin synthase family protein [Pseudobdellovibrionaceae bacterium]